MMPVAVPAQPARLQPTEEQMRLAHEQQMKRDAEQHLLNYLGRDDPLPGRAGLDTVTRLQEKVDEVGGLFGGCVGQVWNLARPVQKGGELGEANTALAAMWAAEIGQSVKELQQMIDNELAPNEPPFDQLKEMSTEEAARLSDLDERGRAAGAELGQMVGKAEAMLADVQEALRLISSHAVEADTM